MSNGARDTALMIISLSSVDDFYKKLKLVFFRLTPRQKYEACFFRFSSDLYIYIYERYPQKICFFRAKELYEIIKDLKNYEEIVEALSLVISRPYSPKEEEILNVYNEDLSLNDLPAKRRSLNRFKSELRRNIQKLESHSGK